MKRFVVRLKAVGGVFTKEVIAQDADAAVTFTCMHSGITADNLLSVEECHK